MSNLPSDDAVNPPIARAAGVRYLTGVPKAIPEGKRLVHNFPPGVPRRPSGAGGFRYWLEADEASDKRSACQCEWEAPPHWTTYRQEPPEAP